MCDGYCEDYASLGVDACQGCAGKR
jgi:hypothetical protein